MGKDRNTCNSDLDDFGAGGGRGWSILQHPGWLHDLNIRTDPFHEYIAWKLFDTGFIVIRWIFGCVSWTSVHAGSRIHPVNSKRASAEHEGVAAASRSTPSSVLASAPGRLRPEAAAVQSERPHAAFQRQLLVVCALRQQRSSQSDSPRRHPESCHSTRVSQSQAESVTASESQHDSRRSALPRPSVCSPAP